MAIIVCTQDHIIPDECPECGGWLHVTTHGGVPGPCGQYCSEDCAASAQTYNDQQARDTHLYQRDLMCRCPWCIAAGHPTDAEIAEYRTYLAAVDLPEVTQ